MAITLLILYYGILLICFVVSLLRYKFYDNALKIVSALMIITFLNELISLVVSYVFKTKSFIFHFYNIIELTLYIYYFINFIYEKPKKWSLPIAFLISAVLGIGNLVFYQPLHKLNTNMLMIECTICIFMSLYALFVLFKSDKILNIYDSHLLIWSSILILMTGTFFFWAGFETLVQQHPTYKMPLYEIQSYINITAYAGICAGLLLSPKKVNE